MLKLYILVVAISMMIACSKTSSQGVFLDMTIDLSIFSPEGSDLLNPENSRRLSTSDLSIFDETGESLDFNLLKVESKYVWRFFANEKITQSEQEIYLKWSSTNLVDTLLVQIERGDEFASINEIELNGTEVYHSAKNELRIVTIVK